MKYLFLALTLLTVIASCQQNKSSQKNSADSSSQKTDNTVDIKTDSLEIMKLLKDVYEWHNKHQNSLIDFDLVVEDTVQTRLNQKSFEKTLSEIQNAGYFSQSFLDNYKRLGALINAKLVNAHPKYLNEINFPFQEADSWTHFQDENPRFWENFRISNFKILGDNASLAWSLPDMSPDDPKYEVKFIKEKGEWKISYLEGFDIEKYYR